MNKFILLTLFPLFMFGQTYETQKYNLMYGHIKFRMKITEFCANFPISRNELNEV